MAMACLRLFTVVPLRPLFSVPRFFLCIARSTSLEADFEYFRAIRRTPIFSFSGKTAKHYHEFLGHRFAHGLPNTSGPLLRLARCRACELRRCGRNFAA